MGGGDENDAHPFSLEPARLPDWELGKIGDLDRVFNSKPLI